LSNYRPNNLGEIVGQDNAKRVLSVLVASYRNTRIPIGHILMSGPSGVGKSTLSSVLSRELGVDMFSRTAARLKRKRDLRDVLDHIEEGDIFFINGIHDVPSEIQEVLCEVMDEFHYLSSDLSDETDGHAVRNKIEVPRFTLIGTTTHPGKLSVPFRERFRLQLHFETYGVGELAMLIANLAKMEYGVDRFPRNVATKLATLSRGNPRCAANLVETFIQVARAARAGTITAADMKMEYVNTLLNMLSIDPIVGLDRMARGYLSVLEREDRPVAIRVVSELTNEQESTIRDTIEPFILSEISIKTSVNGVVYDIHGPLARATASGRELTEVGREYLTACRRLGVKL